MRSLRITAFAIAATAAVIGLAACTGSGGGGSDSSAHSAHSVAGGAVAGAPAAAPSEPAHGAPLARPSQAVMDDVQLGGAKIRTAQMTVSIHHGVSVSSQADRAETIALGARGEVDADDRTSGSYAEATLVFRVPPDQLNPVLDQLARLGAERSRHLSTQDVTGKVADVNSRVASARVEITRLRTLYAHATKISDVITVESELAERESALESLEAQQRALAAETATAMITLDLASAPAPAPKPTATHHRSGFVGGLQNGWHAFTHVMGSLATAAGAILPFALLGLALVVIARLLWPRLRRTPAATPPQ